MPKKTDADLYDENGLLRWTVIAQETGLTEEQVKSLAASALRKLRRACESAGVDRADVLAYLRRRAQERDWLHGQQLPSRFVDDFYGY